MNRLRFVAAGTALLLLVLSNSAFAGGAYQRTDDRKKTLVWNNDPQPGDAATWTGGRDAEGYAEGSGTLTWLRTEKKSLTGSNISSGRKVPISHYTGKMVHGKFEGPVTTIDRGKSFHATFADGQRKGHWISGDVVAKAAESGESKPASEERPEPSSSAKATTTTETIESEQPKAAEQTTEAPAEGPLTTTKENVERPSDAALQQTTSREQTPRTSGSVTPNTQRPISEPARAEISAETLRKGSSPLIAQASEESDQSATPQKPVTKKNALAPGAVRAIDRPSQQAEKKSENPKEVPQKIKKVTKVEEPKTEPTNEQAAEPPAEGPGSAAAEKPQAPSSKTTKAEVSEVFQPPTLNVEPSANATPVDDSIRTLTGPPSSLRPKATTTPVASPALPDSAPSVAPAPPPPSAEPKLNAVNAMDIADIEARERGYDLGEYQLPKAEYNATDDTWSVSYIGRDEGKSDKHLSVVIQDKTGKAEVKK